jgi:Rrf2 family protein
MITRATEYACLAMIYLAKQPPGASCFTAEIAKAEHIPASFLVKVVNQLVKAGLVVSRRGQNGGLGLGKDAAQITLKDIVAVTEGELAVNVCTGTQEYACFRAGCALKGAFLSAQHQYLESLDSVTLAQLAQVDGYPSDRPLAMGGV